MMPLTYFNLAWVMLVSGLCGLGDGLGGISFMRSIVGNNAWIGEVGNFDQPFAHAGAFSQIGGYAQSMIFSAVVGSKLGVLGSILAVACYCLPSIIVVCLLLQIGIKFYKSRTFVYTLKYMNILSLAFICGVVFTVTLYVFGVEPMFYTFVAGLVCVARLVYRVNPAILIAFGGICGIILRA